MKVGGRLTLYIEDLGPIFFFEIVGDSTSRDEGVVIAVWIWSLDGW